MLNGATSDCKTISNILLSLLHTPMGVIVMISYTFEFVLSFEYRTILCLHSTPWSLGLCISVPGHY